MPPVRVSRTNSNPFIAKAQRNGNSASGAPTADVAPDEVAAIRSSIAGKEQAPSPQQLAAYVNWRAIADTLGDPYQTEHIPISKLKMMRRDPTMGFGLSFIKTPHVRARWYVNAKDSNGPNAQVAAHLDHDLRLIMASFILQYANSLDFGFQGIAKRFEFGIPAGTYVAQGADGQVSEQPIWSQGSVQPIRWKPFVALPPETVEPIWGNDGSFNGISFDASSSGGQAPSGTGAAPKGGGQKDQFDIDLYHSLWVTNERDQNFGSIFGYPRLGYAYRYWWSYWFRWAIADRAFEKKADPTILIYHPQGSFIDPTTGQQTSYSDYALNMGYRMRSGGVMTVPSTPYEGTNGPTSLREWEIDFTKDMVNFDPFDKSFDYLDIGKIRSLWIPEQALVEGRGGTSSRNVAAELDSSFTESQAVMSIQIAETINRWIVPQWVAANYPEFLTNGGTAKVVIQGFADEDITFTQQIIQLIGQQPSGINQFLTLVDLQKILDDAGVPLLDIQQQQQQLAKVIQLEQAQSSPNPVAPQGGSGGTVGVSPAPSAPLESGGGQNDPTGTGGDPGTTSTGFSHKYIQPREVIYLTRKDVYGDEEDAKIRIKRVPDSEDGVIARFDPDESTIFLAESVSMEDSQRYIAKVGQALVNGK
jgi:hypothetical protein